MENRPRQLSKRPVVRRKVPSVKTTLTLFVLLLSAFADGQAEPPSSQGSKGVPLKTYINDVLAFELAYPAGYQPDDLSCRRAQWATGHGLQVLLFVTTGRGKDRGSLTVSLDRRRFDQKTIGKHYEHTGWVEPSPERVSGQTFYYIGPGGGGVTYPDTFFYNLGGRILIIEFDGPYPTESKTPSDTTKAIEKLVLQSLRIRGNPRFEE